MNKLVKLLIITGLLLCATTSFAKGREQVLKSDSLGAIYINAGKIFNLYLDQARELLKPANAAELQKIEDQLQRHFPGKFSFTGLFKELCNFADSALCVPDGALWFAMDEELRPAISVSARIKPQELFEFVQKHLGKNKVVPVKNQKDLIEFDIPTPGFNLTLSVTRQGVTLFAGSKRAKEDQSRWKSLFGDADDGSTLVAAEIDISRIKNWLTEKAQSGKRSESFECLSRFKILSAALQMHKEKKDIEMVELDQSVLKSEGYINEQLYCPQSGLYSLNNDKELACSIHGTVSKPVWSTKIPRVAASTHLKPFESFRALISSVKAEIRTRINDRNLLEQWVAIGKQQLQAVRHMAANQMGQLPEEQRLKGLKLLDSIKIAADGDWLKVSIEDLDEKTMLAGITGITGAAAAIAEPYLKRAGAAIRKRLSNRRAKRAEAKAEAGSDKVAAECVAVRKSAYDALANLLVDEDNLPETFGLDYLKEKGYLQAVPDCPAGSKYELLRDGIDFEIKCPLHDQK
ncbi:MAG: hypothetical protein CVV41_15875 [Candidatus Riflebacteria bacterium HGW-Riflebacteria-1]|jgi:ribosomal protein L12E/L44/L45/RPP1/RPP2|nr:MAG: hypothetical protein CVV41_15875 [Candidatus Riflebacteria bacterium HGW-Riflebacteria-1]